MKHTMYSCFVFSLITVFSPDEVFGELSVAGISTMVLNAPATSELNRIAEKTARDSLRGSLTAYLEKQCWTDRDSMNPVLHYHISSLAQLCLKKAEKESFLEGKTWTLAYRVPETLLTTILADYSNECRERIAGNHEKMKEAVAANQHEEVYRSGVKILFYRMGLCDGGKTGVDEFSAITQYVLSVFDSLHVRTDQAIFSGKPGEPAENEVVVTVTFGDTPVTGVALRAAIPGRKELFTAKTDSTGAVSLKGMSVPYTATGTILSIRPDAGRVLNDSFSFSLEDLGLSVYKKREATLMFKIIRSSFSLNYQLKPLGDIALPDDFTQSAFLEHYLVDSCFLRKAGSGQADLAIDITCQVRQYEYDAKEQTVVEVEGIMTITPDDTEKQPLTHEGTLYSEAFEWKKQELRRGKKNKRESSLPLGLFYWHFGKTLKETVRRMLREL